MSTKELIQSTLETMNESQLETLYPIVKQLAQTTQAPPRRAFGLLANDPNASGNRTVADFLADRRAEAQAELNKAAI